MQNVLGDDYDHFESKLNAKVGGIFKEWADAVLFARFETFVENKDGKVTIKDCIIGVLVTFGILVMYAVAGMLEAV